MTLATQRRKSVLVILRRAYLEITNNHCAAKLIEYFKHWRDWKIETQRSEWVYMPFKWIYEDLMGEHSIHVIRKAITKLLELNILSHRHNPDNGQDKTWQYRLNVDALENLLAERGECNSALSSGENNQTYTQNPTQISQPQQTAANKKSRKEIKKAIAATPILAPSVEPENQLRPANKISKPHDTQSSALDCQELLTQVQAAGIVFSPQMQLLVQSQPAETVSAALAYTQYQVKRGKVQDISAYFVSAVKGSWKLPAHVKESEQLDLFSQWFNLANSQGLVKYSIKEGDKILVSTDGQQWQQFETALHQYPLARLRQENSIPENFKER